ncbi:COG1470 family protein [Agromyces bauzanensis]
MVTVVDIDPASLAVTPGQAETFTLTVRNDGDDVEAYHLSAAGDAADQVVIQPETLLVHPGETGTATATITLEHGGRWPVGDLIVRFEVVPATHPDDLVAVEAIVSIRSFSEVDAVLSPTALEGRRGDETVISIANSGNTHAYADIAVSAGELTVAMDRARATIPAGSTETVELGLRVPKPLWRGDPVAHPFFVTVTPEDAPAVPLEGTFTQLPVFSKWALTAALGAAGVLVVLAAVWLAALAWNNAVKPVAASQSPTATAETSAPAPVDVGVELVADDLGQAGDAAVTVLDAEIDDAPDGALVAVEVEWPDELGLADSTCEGWVGAEIDRELQGPPRSGDECLIDPSRSRTSAELTFATPPAGFSGEVTATATRLVTLDDGEVEELETGAGSDFGDAELAIEVQPYPFWLEVVVADPPEFDDGRRQATIGVHRTLARDGTDESARMAFEFLLPGFAELSFMEGCDALGANEATCVLFFPSDLEFWSVTATFETRDDPPDAGPVSAAGVELEVGGVPVPPSEVGERIRGADALLIAVDDLFPVDVELDTDEAEAGEAVTATVAVTHTPLPNDVDAFRDGSWVLGLELSWPDALVLNGEPSGCASFDRGVCELPGPAGDDRAVVTLSFTVADDAFENGDVAANGASLVYDPTTEADERDGREVPPVELPREWIGSDAATFFPF